MFRILLSCFFICCISSNLEQNAQSSNTLEVGADRISQYLPILKGKKVGLLVNHSSLVNSVHLVDTLTALDVSIGAIFSPEHGYRGSADAGSKIDDEILDNIPIYSLYGKNRKPQSGQLKDIDILLFDIQDVGTRFYTYISTMHLAMEACAENNVEFIVLDRPNPNGHYIDGPLLDIKHQSFVGMHPIPIVHGLTVGELAKMIVGERWLETGKPLNLMVVPCLNYRHDLPYDLPVKPSPNLPNRRSILLYPSLCLFEGTVMSVGRGTTKQFQIFGHPKANHLPDTFTPVPSAGAQRPKWQDQLCYGLDLSTLDVDDYFLENHKLKLEWLIEAYSIFEDPQFFNENNFFDKLAGTSDLREAIISGKTAAEIRESWEEDLTSYEAKRQLYLLYP